MTYKQAQKIDLREMGLYEAQEFIYQEQDFKLYIVDNMRQYAGSFVMTLAECIERADHNNFNKLFSVFSNYFFEYQPKEWFLGTRKK